LLSHGREEEQKTGSSIDHGQPVVDATVRGRSVTASLFIFPDRVAEIDLVFP